MSKAKVAKKSTPVKKRGNAAPKRGPRQSPTADEALRELERIGRDSVAAGTDKLTDDEIDAEIRDHRKAAEPACGSSWTPTSSSAPSSLRAAPRTSC